MTSAYSLLAHRIVLPRCQLSYSIAYLDLVLSLIQTFGHRLPCSSVFVLADVSVWPPRKMFILITRYNIYTIKVSRKCFIRFWKQKHRPETELSFPTPQRHSRCLMVIMFSKSNYIVIRYFAHVHIFFITKIDNFRGDLSDVLAETKSTSAWQSVCMEVSLVPLNPNSGRNVKVLLRSFDSSSHTCWKLNT